jgi:hypothetical protein
MFPNGFSAPKVQANDRLVGGFVMAVGVSPIPEGRDGGVATANVRRPGNIPFFEIGFEAPSRVDGVVLLRP